MTVRRLALVLPIFACLSQVLPVSAETVDEHQMVIVSFDGAHDNRLWTRSRAMAETTGARFTYFLSCTFLMTREQGRTYRGPGQQRGRSNVGFAPDTADVATRLDHIWRAHEEGHEMASHGCGHFDGKGWNKAQWTAEFSAFSHALARAWTNAGRTEDEPQGWQDFAHHAIAGFRAPYLSTNKAMQSALSKAGFTYDASGVSHGPADPERRGSLTLFDLPLIKEGPRNRRIIAMDYNLFVRHSGGVENAVRSRQFEERAYQAFRQAFDAEYGGKRRPLQIGMHFVEMNGGAYWRAVERLLSEVCGKVDVDCIPYEEALRRINKNDRDGGA